ncbi:peroxiredoxin [Paracoccus aminophilus]|uniref:Glutathione-dependent peroxiredoxin n=1 Tax=Paracoccus aminophilus JCM 7686 TaxID=1367847 RepID=S5YQT6_PARAH|nr:peroxiredoxin [Paracoccus aminophilus]AGT07611.1 peroxiredoxin AhpC [Paracoccus aminophilus JCM 7686]
MAITTGEKLPHSELLKLGAEGTEKVDLSALSGKIAIFGVPGAFTPGCSQAHMPSFIRTADQFRAKGVAGIYCVTVNDPFVTKAWAKDTGADQAGIEVLADADGAYTKALGLNFDAAAAGLYGRTKRYAMLVTDGVVDVLELEVSPGVCELSAGENLLKSL